MNLNLLETGGEYRSVTLGKDAFEVEVSRPTFADRLRDTELIATGRKADGKWIENRLKSTITGWRNLHNGESQELAFSWETLGLVCGQYEEIYHQLVKLAHEAYRGLGDGAKKN